MSHSYTDAAVFDSAITLPDDGDKIDAASVNVALEAIADRTRYLGQFVVVDECSTGMPANNVTTDVIGSTTSATNALLANVTAFDVEIQRGDVIHFSCTFNAQVTSTGDGWIGASLLYHDANDIVQYAGFYCNWCYVSGSNTEIRQYTISGAMKVAVSPKTGTSSGISLWGKVASGTLALRNPLSCIWTVMRSPS